MRATCAREPWKRMQRDPYTPCGPWSSSVRHPREGPWWSWWLRSGLCLCLCGRHGPAARLWANETSWQSDVAVMAVPRSISTRGQRPLWMPWCNGVGGQQRRFLSMARCVLTPTSIIGLLERTLCWSQCLSGGAGAGDRARGGRGGEVVVARLRF